MSSSLKCTMDSEHTASRWFCSYQSSLAL